MRYQFWAISSVLLCAALTSGTCAAQEQNPPSDSQKGTGQKVGEKIDEAIRDIKQGVDEVSESVRERFARARESVNTMGVESRVYGRLHWDKDLNKAKIDLEVRQGGVATLRGTVADTAAKAKAELLARETVGVTQVVNLLTLSPPTSETAPASSRTGSSLKP